MTDALKINEVTETHLITGPYDVLAVLEVRKTPYPRYPKVIAEIVMDKISKIRGVQDTETIIPDLSKNKS